MNQITARIARKDELSIALNLLREAALWLKKEGIDYWQSWINPAIDYIDWIKSGLDNQEFYFVEENREIIGMYRLQYSDEMFWGKRQDKAGYIHSFTIKRELAGKGIGRTILKMIEKKLADEDIQCLRLDCGSEVKRLCQYYEENGFKKVDEREVFGFMANFYEKKLN